jgi:hypothetical protein
VYLTKVLRHPMLSEPIVWPRVVVSVLAVLLAAVGVEVGPVDELQPFTAGDVIVALSPLALAYIGQAFTARARTDSPLTVAAQERRIVDLLDAEQVLRYEGEDTV